MVVTLLMTGTEDLLEPTYKTSCVQKYSSKLNYSHTLMVRTYRSEFLCPPTMKNIWNTLKL